MFQVNALAGKAPPASTSVASPLNEMTSPALNSGELTVGEVMVAVGR